MSHRLVCLCATTFLVLILPAAALAQNKHCCCPSSSSITSTSSQAVRTPTYSRTHCTPSRTSFQNPLSPNSQRTPNTPTNLRRFNQPNLSLSRPQNPQLQQAVQQNLLMQQTMMQQVHQQYQLQDQIKQQLLTYALDAPTENLQRELKNSNVFVRWAASVELNRRWRLEKSVTVAEARVPREMPAPAALPRNIRTAIPATVTSSDQALLLQYGIPNAQ